MAWDRSVWVGRPKAESALRHRGGPRNSSNGRALLRSAAGRTMDEGAEAEGVSTADSEPPSKTAEFPPIWTHCSGQVRAISPSLVAIVARSPAASRTASVAEARARAAEAGNPRKTASASARPRSASRSIAPADMTAVRSRRAISAKLSPSSVSEMTPASSAASDSVSALSSMHPRPLLFAARSQPRLGRRCSSNGVIGGKTGDVQRVGGRGA